MKIENIDIQATIEKAQSLIRDDKQMSSGTRAVVEILILVITLLANRLNLNSSNSSKPPSSDPNREKKPKSKSSRKKGGQKGHVENGEGKWGRALFAPYRTRVRGF